MIVAFVFVIFLHPFVLTGRTNPPALGCRGRASGFGRVLGEWHRNSPISPCSHTELRTTTGNFHRGVAQMDVLRLAKTERPLPAEDKVFRACSSRQGSGDITTLTEEGIRPISTCVVSTKSSALLLFVTAALFPSRPQSINHPREFDVKRQVGLRDPPLTLEAIAIRSCGIIPNILPLPFKTLPHNNTKLRVVRAA